MNFNPFRALRAPTPGQIIARELLAHQRDLVQAKISLASAQSIVQYRLDVIRELEGMLAKYREETEQ